MTLLHVKQLANNAHKVIIFQSSTFALYVLLLRIFKIVQVLIFISKRARSARLISHLQEIEKNVFR